MSKFSKDESAPFGDSPRGVHEKDCEQKRPSSPRDLVAWDREVMRTATSKAAVGGVKNAQWRPGGASNSTGLFNGLSSELANLKKSLMKTKKK